MDNPTDSSFSTDQCKRLLEELILSDSEKLRITIVIDALDECEDGYELLKVLSNIVQTRKQSIRLLLSSQLHTM